MKGKIFGWIILITLMLIPMALCCGVAFADDGIAAGSGVDALLVALWVAIGAVAMTLLNLYIDVLKPKLVAIWAVKTDDFWYKFRCSFLAVFVDALFGMLKEAYKRGLLDAIIAIIVKIIRAKLGIPTAVKAAAKQVDKIFPVS